MLGPRARSTCNRPCLHRRRAAASTLHSQRRAAADRPAGLVARAAGPGLIVVMGIINANSLHMSRKSSSKFETRLSVARLPPSKPYLPLVSMARPAASAYYTAPYGSIHRWSGSGSGSGRVAETVASAVALALAARS
jgi:hypothetical protein